MIDARHSRTNKALADVRGQLGLKPAGTAVQPCSSTEEMAASYQAEVYGGGALNMPSGKLPTLGMSDGGSDALDKEINQKLDEAYFWETDNVARECVSKLTPEQLSSLPNATKTRLWDELNSGIISDEDQTALDKLDKSVPTSYGKRIKVEGNMPFRISAIESLDRLGGTATGKAILASRDASSRTVTIQEYSGSNGYTRPYPKSASNDIFLDSKGKAGAGTDSTILFNPDFRPDKLPNEVVLGHELIHAEHFSKGIVPPTQDKNGLYMDEELQTMGLPPYPETGLTENSIRADLKLPKRTKYNI